MHTYDIQRLLYASSTFVPAELAGFSFIDEWSGGRVVASRSIESESWEEAVRLFELQLLETLDAIAVVAGEAVSSYAGAILSIRADLQTAALDAMLPAGEEEEEKNDRRLHAEQNEIQRAVEAVRSDDETRHAARHFRESLLTTSGLVSSIHLLRSLEALAGREETVPKCSCGEPLTCQRGHEQQPYPRTIRSEEKRILANEAAFQFFYGERGHRNALMHGGYEAQEEMRPHVRPLLRSVFDELRERMGAPASSDNPIVALIRGDRYGLPASLQVYDREVHWLRYSGELPRVVDLMESLRSGELSRRGDLHVLRDGELTKALDGF